MDLSKNTLSGNEVADIFRQFGPVYRESHPLLMRMLKTMSAIERCRTAVLGGHVDQCDSCGYLRISYNSCRNRHCPKCQSLPREKWLAARKRDLLPVEYFHIVFTVPDLLNPLALRNQKVIYDILFKAASRALLALSKDPKHLGAEIGFISILHTWGQNLMDHPHLHCLVPGGGLSLDGKRWISSRGGFFIPVKVLSRLFRGKFLFYLKEAYRGGKLKFVGEIRSLGDTRKFQMMMDELYRKQWVLYCKPPFRSPKQLLEYLGRYTHRVAISNHRLVKVEDGKVTFRWRDYKDGNKNKQMTLEAFEFIQRFLLHILPNNFVKIRHYGLLSNRNRQTKLRQCQKILGSTSKGKQQSTESEGWERLLFELTGIDPRICPCCGKGRMVTREILSPQGPAPPGEVRWVA
jgi:predicted Zn-ribbon and HTH transcriptional regulator